MGDIILVLIKFLIVLSFILFLIVFSSFLYTHIQIKKDCERIIKSHQELNDILYQVVNNITKKG